MFDNRSILLRKVDGQLEGCFGSEDGLVIDPSHSMRTFGGFSLGVVGQLLTVLLVPLLALAAAALLLLGHQETALALATAPVAVTSADIKAVRDEIMKAVTEMRDANDERIKQMEAKGSADAALVAKVENANKAITDLTAQLRELENTQARSQLINVVDEKEQRTVMARARQWLAAARGVADASTIEVGADELKALDEYSAGLRAYLRRGQVNAAMSVGSGPDGGYLVSPDKSGRIVEMLYETSPMRQLATIETTTSDVFEGGTDLDEAGAGWVGETEDRSGNTDTPQIGEWSIPIHEIYAEPQTTQKILDDASRDPEAWLARKVADKFSRTENAAFVNGNGVKKPKGFLQYADASATTAANWRRIRFIKSGAAGAFAAQNPGDKLIDVMHALKAGLRSGAVWAMNNLTLAEVRKLKDGDGNYLWIPSFQAGTSGQLLGHGVTEFADMPDIANNALSIAFGNFREGYTIVDRIGVRVLRDPLTKKGWVKFYTTKRVGGDVTNFEAIVLVKFAA